MQGNAGPVRIGILGAGAMGSYFGVFLALAGHDVVLVDEDAGRMAAVERQGLTLLQSSSCRTAALCAGCKPSLLAEVEVVVVLTKANRLDAALGMASAHVDAAAKVVVLCNGLGCREVARHWVHPEHLFYGTTAAGAVLVGQSAVRETVRGDTYIGRFTGGRDEELLDLAARFTEASLTTVASDDVDCWIWTKLLVNVAFNAATSVVGSCNGSMVETDPGRNLVKELVEETASVASGLGVRLQCRDPVEYVLQVGTKIAQQRSSMLQDLEHRRATEVDYINGAVVEEARRVGLGAPANSVLTCLVHLREHELGIFRQ